jgi:hypothetical protein
VFREGKLESPLRRLQEAAAGNIKVTFESKSVARG